ncbi:hypothetical protein SRHO_G00169910 [Serrasalmus rhombeus]
MHRAPTTAPPIGGGSMGGGTHVAPSGWARPGTMSECLATRRSLATPSGGAPVTLIQAGTSLPWETLPGAFAPDNIAPRIIQAHKTLHHDKVVIHGEDTEYLLQ